MRAYAHARVRTHSCTPMQAFACTHSNTPAASSHCSPHRPGRAFTLLHRAQALLINPSSPRSWSLPTPSTKRPRNSKTPGGREGQRKKKALCPQPTLPGRALASGLVQFFTVKPARGEKGEAGGQAGQREWLVSEKTQTGASGLQWQRSEPSLEILAVPSRARE